MASSLPSNYCEVNVSLVQVGEMIQLEELISWCFAFSCFLFYSRPFKRNEKEYLQYFQGQLKLTLDQAREGTEYSYVNTIGENVIWEDLTEFSSKFRLFRSSTDVRRALKIPNDHIQPGGK